MKWLSDEELNSCKVLGGIEYWPHIIDQAREANRLREDNERLMAIAQAESEEHSRLRDGLELWRKRVTEERDHLRRNGGPSSDPFVAKTEITLDHLNELLEGE